MTLQYKHNINVHIVGKYSINLYSLQNRKGKLARGLLFFLFWKFAKINFIFANKVHIFYIHYIFLQCDEGQLWSWLYDSWNYHYLCNKCLSPLKLRVQSCSWGGVLDTTLCNKVCQSLTAGQWFSPGTLVSSTNKTACHDITEILLKVVLNTITLTLHYDDR